MGIKAGVLIIDYTYTWNVCEIMDIIETNISGSAINPLAYYTSMEQCANITGISKTILKKCKALGAPGFVKRSGRIDWKQFEPWFSVHKGEVISASDDSLEFYKKEIAKRDVTLRDLSIAQKREELIDPVEIKKFLTQLGIILSSVLKKQRQELMSKAVGYEKIIDEAFQNTFKFIETEIEKWN